jgi:chaperone modulatory protein CbpM
VLQPAGQQPQEWRFTGAALRRARLAQRLAQDLEVNMPGVALALDLLDQIERLQAQLAQLSRY